MILAEIFVFDGFDEIDRYVKTELYNSFENAWRNATDYPFSVKGSSSTHLLNFFVEFFKSLVLHFKRSPKVRKFSKPLCQVI